MPEMWEMQSTTRAIVAYAERVHGTVFEPGSVILTWAVEFSGQVVSRFQRSVSDGKTAKERRKLKSYRKALVEQVMVMPMENPKTRVKCGTVLVLCWVSWTDLTKSSLVGEGSYLNIACLWGSEVMLLTQREAEGAPLGMPQGRIVSVRWLQSRKDWQFQSWSRGITKPVGSHPVRSGAREVQILR